MKNIILLSCLLISFNSMAQVQWACKVAETNDPNPEKDFSPVQALFIPDAYPSKVSANSYSFIMGYSSGEKKTKIKVEFCNPIVAKQVAIIEACGAGSITSVSIEDTKGKEKNIYKGSAVAAGERRVFSLPVSNATPIRYVYIEAEPGKVEGWNCIDAIGLSPSADPVNCEINLSHDIDFVSTTEPLSANINTQYEDILPIISPDESTLFIDRKNDPSNIRNNDPNKYDKICDDIYYSKKVGNDWSLAANIGRPLNNDGHNFVNSISPDGNTILLANGYDAKGEQDGAGASISHKTKGGYWKMPEKLNIVDFNNENQYVSFFMTNNNKVLLMSIETTGTIGLKDIFASFLQADGVTWSKPMNIGTDVNTELDEYSPVLASDGVTLYFSSKGHYGYGSYDHFMSKRLDDTWTKWSTPINLGPKINTSGGDMGFSIPASGKRVYTYSWNNQSNKSDIYVTEIANVNSIKPNPVYLVSGRVFNAKTKQPIAAKILYETLPDGTNVGIASSSPDHGDYKIVLPVGEHYGYMAQADGYIAVHENLDIPEGKQYTEVHQDLYLVPIEVGQVIQLNNVFFVQSTSNLLETSHPELDRMVSILNLNPKIEIELDGHTDNQGDPKKNVELSQKRVDVVKAYLVNKGIAASRITTKAFGGSKPIASNAKEETRKLNRRVEFTITKH